MMQPKGATAAIGDVSGARRRVTSPSTNQSHLVKAFLSLRPVTAEMAGQECTAPGMARTNAVLKKYGL